MPLSLALFPCFLLTPPLCAQFVRPSLRPKVTSAEGPHFQALKRAIQETWQLPEYNYVGAAGCVELSGCLCRVLVLLLSLPAPPPPRAQTAPAVVPFLTTGGTDSKHYAPLSRSGVLRFVPYLINKTAGDLGRVHGTNERVERAHFLRAVCTYSRIMQLMAGPTASSAWLF